MATMAPIKNPTAIELWNLRMIIVPPILSIISMSADHIDANPSARVLVPETNIDMSIRLPVTPRIEYLQNVIYKIKE